MLLGRWLKCPVTITLRGTEARHARDRALRPLLIKALTGANRIITVSDSLRRLALELGVAPERAQVVANGVDAQKFHPADRAAMRARFGLPAEARVLITVGGLVETKGLSSRHRTAAGAAATVPGPALPGRGRRLCGG